VLLPKITINSISGSNKSLCDILPTPKNVTYSLNVMLRYSLRKIEMHTHCGIINLLKVLVFHEVLGRILLRSDQRHGDGIQIFLRHFGFLGRNLHDGGHDVVGALRSLGPEGGRRFDCRCRCCRRLRPEKQMDN